MMSQLSRRDRIALAFGAAAILVTLAFLGVVEPYRASKERLQGQIAARERQLAEVRQLRQEYLQLQKQVEAGRGQLERSEGFSLFTFVEQLITQVARKDNLVYMRPQQASVRDEVREESVEIKLEKIEIDQLVRLLYRIDTSEAFLGVKSMRLKTRFDDQSLFDVVLTIASYGRNA